MRLLALLVALLLPGAVCAQSLGEAAAREKQKKGRKPVPVKVYTEEDLKKAGAAGSAVSVLGTPASPDTAQAGAAGEAPPAGQGGSAGEGEEEWQNRAQARRDAIRRADDRVNELRSRIDALRNDRSPTNLQDPSRQQSLQAEIAAATVELETAEKQQAEARQALEALEEEARRNRIPPGWLREREPRQPDL